MGFMDKAKKMAEQAQEKLDDVQKQFNEGQGAKAGAAAPDAPVTEYDKHGRPVGETPAPAPPPSSPPPGPAGEPGSPPPPPEAPTPPARPAPGGPGEEAAPPPKPPKPPGGDLAAPDQKDDEHAAPKLSSGDPLAG